MAKLQFLLLIACAMPFSGHAVETLPEEALFSDHRRSLFTMSPGGGAIAFAVRDSEGEHIDVRNLENGTQRRVFSSGILPSDDVRVAGIVWIDDELLFSEVYEITEGVARLSDTRNRRHHFVVDLADQSKGSLRYIQSPGSMIGAMPAVDEEFLFAVAGTRSFVYRVNARALPVWGSMPGKTDPVDGGQLSRPNRVTSVDGLALAWLSDSAGVVRAVMYWKESEGIQLSSRADNSEQWQADHVWRAAGRKKKDRRKQFEADLDAVEFRLLSLLPDDERYLVSGDTEEGRQAIFRLDLDTGERELVYEHPNAEVLGISLDHAGEQLLSVRYFEHGYVREHHFRTDMAAVSQRLQKRFPEYESLMVGWSADRERIAVLVYASHDPGRILVVDGTGSRIIQEIAVAPELRLELRKAESDRFETDGLEVEYFLTKPEKTPAPLVVYPHGGPFGVMDDLQFDPVVQYLAASGLAVLQVNYRGSGGYGSRFLEAGRGEFGDMMLADMEKALQIVSADPALDPDQVCIFGESYGGYAALMLAIRNPAAFRCLASFAGVTDLGLLLDERSEESRQFLLDLFIGDYDDERDAYERLKALSPVYLLDTLEVPVFLAHGSRDRRVDVEHAYRLKLMMEKAGKPLEWHVYPETGHGFDSASEQLTHIQRVMEFLRRHLFADRRGE